MIVDNHQEAAPQEPEGSLARYHPKVLIVDDEPKNVKLVSAMLSQKQFRIFHAFDGREAIDTVRNSMPDVILLDIMMPGMNGYQVVEILKADPNTKNIPIILITALDGTEHRVKGMSAGAEEFLNKPVNSVELLARINSMLRLKQYREQLYLRKQLEERFTNASLVESSPRCPNKLPRILLVEDDLKEAKIIQAYLAKEKYELIHAENGETGIKIARHEKVDLIILDIMLPDISGYAVCKQLKEMNITRGIPIIFATSLSDAESKLEGINAECDDFLVKPVNKLELKAKIQLLLKKKRHLEELQSRYESVISTAINDGLTGLSNHSYFKRFLTHEIKRSDRQGYSMALMMIDLDDFKKYNDNLGHPVGDVILQGIGHLIKNNVRDIDLAARYGGEEFAVVLPYTEIEGARVAAERIRSALNQLQLPIEIPLTLGKLTVSIGIAIYPLQASSAEELIVKADENLYNAKKTGKNKVCISI